MKMKILLYTATNSEGRGNAPRIAILSAIGLALLPKLTCPACWPAYAGLLSSFGIGFFNYTSYLLPITFVFLIVAVAALIYRAKARRGYGPFVLGLLASIAILVVLAAGTMNTLKLLLHSRSVGGLDDMPGLGEHFGGNGDLFGYWALDDRQRDLAIGMPAHGALRPKQEDALGDNGPWPLVAEGALPPARMLPFKGLMQRFTKRGSYVAGMGADAQDGRVSYRGGKLRIDYDSDRCELFARIKAAFADIGEKTGCKIYYFKRPITVHPTGGACIGQDKTNGVIDSNGEVFGNPGLFVADAAAFPKPIGGPPALSIGVWPDHIAEHFLARR